MAETIMPAFAEQDEIPAVVDNLTSTSTTSALSANQGYTLNNKIARYDIPTSVSSNLNNCKESGYYIGNSGSNTQNLPRNGYFVVLVMPYSSNDIAQLAVEVNTGDIYRRVFHDGSTWTSWNILVANKSETFTSTTYDSTKLVNVSGVKKGIVCSVVVTIKGGLSVGWYNATVTGIPSAYYPAGIVYGNHRINSSADQDKYAYAQLDTGGTISFYCGGGFSADIPFSFTYVV